MPIEYAEDAIRLTNRSTAMEQERKENERAGRLEQFRAHEEYGFGLGEASELLGRALSEIADAAGAGLGLRKRRISVSIKARPPQLKHYALALGRAEGLAELLRKRDFVVELGEPYPTHDYDGHNAVCVTVDVTW